MTLRDASRNNAALILGSSLLLLLCLAVPAARAQAQAQADATLSSWEQLSPEQREELIGPLRERWNSQPEARARMLGNARRWQQLNPEQRQRAQRGLNRLEQMTPEQRQKARDAYQRLQQSPVDAESREPRVDRTQKAVPQQRRPRRLRQRSWTASITISFSSTGIRAAPARRPT